MPQSEAQFLSLRTDSADSVESYLLDADGLDAVLFLHCLVVYVAMRLVLSWLFPGAHETAATANARKYARQQYIMVFLQKGVLLPLCGLGWQRGALPPELIYLLTGCYILSDSMVNRSPIRGGSWGGNVGVHAHHVFTLVFCLVGAHLPTGLVSDAAVVILVGEVGSLWLTVTILRPTSTNIKIRFYTFVASRTTALLIALDSARKTERPSNQLLILLVTAFLLYDNWRTLRAMSGKGGPVAGSLGRSDSLAADMHKKK